MMREVLGHLPVVALVARKRGFAAAAAELGMSASAVSHAVKAVEDAVGAPLFARTTRSVALTEAGARFMEAIVPALSSVGEALEQVASTTTAIRGTFRINAPRVALPMAITAIVADLAERHPGLAVELTLDDGLVDIVAAGCDAGVRLGGMIAKDMIASRLTAPFRAIMVASPAYLKKHGRPTSIGELARHNCIGLRLVTSGSLYAWDLADRGSDVSVSVRGSVVVSDPLAARELALASIGIAYVFEPLVADALSAKRLIHVLPGASVEEPGLFLYYPRQASKQPKTRAFVEAARARLRAK